MQLLFQKYSSWYSCHYTSFYDAQSLFNVKSYTHTEIPLRYSPDTITRSKNQCGELWTKKLQPPPPTFFYGTVNSEPNVANILWILNWRRKGMHIFSRKIYQKTHSRYSGYNDYIWGTKHQYRIWMYMIFISGETRNRVFTEMIHRLWRLYRLKSRMLFCKITGGELGLVSHKVAIKLFLYVTRHNIQQLPW